MLGDHDFISGYSNLMDRELGDFEMGQDPWTTPKCQRVRLQAQRTANTKLPTRANASLEIGIDEITMVVLFVTDSC